ncbi:MAG: TVP38/TMEM64 family protein [Polyangiaceae bacterium]|nr:TVP38/TMEM64 family protein [Polyangiaceae bacterium]
MDEQSHFSEQTDRTELADTPESSEKRVVLLAAVLVVSLGLCAYALFVGKVRPDTIQGLVADGGAWSMVGYVGIVVVAELLWLPRMWGLFAGGVLFGPVLGAALSLVSDSIAAMLCYVIARTTGRDYVARLVARNISATKVVRLLADRQGAATIALLRVCPIAHYTLVSYAAGVAGVGVRSFLVGSTLGILPGAILYPIVGDAFLKPSSPVFYISLGVLVVFLIVTVLAGRRTLASVEERPAPPVLRDSEPTVL